MADAMLKRLEEEHRAKTTFIQELTETATNESRDLTENELELIKRSKDRIGSILKQMDVLSMESELSESAQRALAHLAPAVTGANVGGSQGGANAGAGNTAGGVEYKSPGAYLRDYIATLIGEGALRNEAEDRLRRYHRAAAHVTTGNFTGVFPNAIVGPVINFINSSRPLTTAIGTQGVPSGPSFRRPKLNDPNMATGMGLQANEKDELVSQPFTMSSDSVDLSTLGGYVNVSRQLLDWGVASMDVVVNQLAARYAFQTERAALVEIQKSLGHEALAANADGGTTVKAIYNAASKVFDATGQLPSILAAGPKGWARLGGLTDLAGRQIFPFMAPGNAAGQQSADSFQGNPVGLRLVVTPAMTDDTFWVLNSYCLEIYEQQVGQLSIVEPSVLGIQCAFAGYVGYYRPAADGAIHVSP
jgi:HK97 family phage major capsid protein